MSHINVLDKDTVNKIAAGEVIERPASVVKELLENAIDSGASQITIEIADGGCKLIRVTDNGCGIDKSDVKAAFLRHATSKIRVADDLYAIHSLGFRGEALSSIAAVSRTELITKTSDSLTGIRYAIEGGEEGTYEDVGAPSGTTIIVRDLFYNTPARKKFLKSATTEAAHVSELIEKIALSHPEVSVRYISNNQTKLQTSGNGSIKDIIYHIYGRDIVGSLLELSSEGEGIKIHGYIGRPEVSRGNRNMEICYINGRYIKSSLLLKAIEQGYGNHMMAHQFPMAVLLYEIDTKLVDINVHPTKMDVRFSDGSLVYDLTIDAVAHTLSDTELVKKVSVGDDRPTKSVPERAADPASIPEPFETVRQKSYEQKSFDFDLVAADTTAVHDDITHEDRMISTSARPHHHIIGQVFSTYWIVEYENSMYIIDQHAAHEKVMYERYMNQLRNSEVAYQNVNPPIIVTLTDREADLVSQHTEDFRKYGFEIDVFGGNEYAVRTVPTILPSIDKAELLKQMIGELSEESGLSDASILQDRVATMACKAAVKGGQKLSYMEISELIDELLGLENPYNCPHGRPTIIEITKDEMEKRFKRIV